MKKPSDTQLGLNFPSNKAFADALTKAGYVIESRKERSFGMEYRLKGGPMVTLYESGKMYVVGRKRKTLWKKLGKVVSAKGYAHSETSDLKALEVICLPGFPDQHKLMQFLQQGGVDPVLTNLIEVRPDHYDSIAKLDRSRSTFYLIAAEAGDFNDSNLALSGLAHLSWALGIARSRCREGTLVLLVRGIPSEKTIKLGCLHYANDLVREAGPDIEVRLQSQGVALKPDPFIGGSPPAEPQIKSTAPAAVAGSEEAQIRKG